MEVRNIYINDDQGRKRIVLSGKDDGSTTIIFAAVEGRVRATLALSNKGIGRIMFLDRFGKRGFIASASVKTNKEIRERGLRMADRRMEGAEIVADGVDSEEDIMVKEYLLSNAFDEPESGAG